MGCGASSQNPEKDNTQQQDGEKPKETEMERKLREKREAEAANKAALKKSPSVGYKSATILCVAFDRHEKLVICGQDSGAVVCRNVADGEIVWQNDKAHGGAVSALDVTHKLEGNSRAVSGGRDGKACIWDAASGREMFSLTGHILPINCVLMSRDDSKIFTGSSDKRIIVWDHRTKREITRLDAHTSLVWSMATSYDGKHLFSGSEDKMIFQWNLESNPVSLVRKWTAHNGPVFALLPTRDGEHLLSASRDRTIKEWAIRGGQETGSFSNGTEAITQLALSKDGGKLFIAGTGLSVMDLAVKRGEKIASDGGLTNGGVITALGISADNLHLGLGTSTGEFLKVDASDFVRPEKLTFHRGTVTALACSPDFINIAASSEDTSVSLWNFASGRLIHRFEGHSSRVWGVCFSEHGTELFTASEDSTIRVWSVVSHKSVAVLRGHNGCVWSVREHDVGQLVSCGDDNTVRLWHCDAEWRVTKQQHMEHSSPVVCIACQRGLIASGSFDNTIKLWSSENSQEIACMEGHTEVVWAVVFTESNGILSGSEDGTIRLWSLSGQQLSVFDIGTPIGSIFYSKESRKLIVGCNNGDLLHIDEPSSKLPSATSDNSVKINSKSHEDSICSIAMNKDCIITGSVDMTIRYWDAVKPPPPEFKVVAAV